MSEQTLEKSPDASRRKFLKYAAAAAGGVVVVGAGGYLAWQATRPPPPKPTLKWMGGSWGIYPEVVEKWENDTGVKVDWSMVDIPSMVQTVMATGGKGFDAFHAVTSIAKPLFEASPPVFQATPVEKLPRWNPEDVAPLLLNPESIGPTFAKHIKPYIWWKGEEGRKLAMTPQLYNFDSFAYNPEFIDHELTSWGELVNREYKGKVAIMDIPTLTVNIWAMYLVKTHQMPEPEEMNNLNPSEVDTVLNWLVEHKKAGQFKSFWSDYGALVNLHSTREIWLSDAWSPAVFDVRRAGVPLYYATNSEGYSFWYSGDVPSASTDNLDTVFQWMDFRLSGWFTKFVARVGYSTPTYPSDETKKEMGPEYYGWAYQGKRTYKPISTIMPGKSEWIANALFLAEKYDWSMQTGNEDPKGNLRDCGPIEDRLKNIVSEEIWLDNAPYYVSAWEKFKQT